MMKLVLGIECGGGRCLPQETSSYQPCSSCISSPILRLLRDISCPDFLALLKQAKSSGFAYPSCLGQGKLILGWDSLVLEPPTKPFHQIPSTIHNENFFIHTFFFFILYESRYNVQLAQFLMNTHFRQEKKKKKRKKITKDTCLEFSIK